MTVTFLRYYGLLNPLTTTSIPSTRPHDTTEHSTHRLSTSERIHTTTARYKSTLFHSHKSSTQTETTVTHTTDQATQPPTHRPTQTQTQTLTGTHTGTDRHTAHTTHSITHVHTTKRLLTSPITFANTTMSKSKVKHDVGNGLEWWCYLVIGLVLFIFYYFFKFLYI